jgi:ParB-like chromosome segregation protein Spo0J
MKQINGNLYLVNIDDVHFADEFENSVFKNPRMILEDELSPKGFNLADMQELRDSIQHNGLKHPFICKKHQGKIQLVAGERRKRCVDKLLAENALCYDQSDRTYKNAKEIYNKIECRVEDIDDLQAFAEAFSENENSRSIGEAETIFLIDKFRKKLKYTDEQILKITNKNSVWLRDTDKLLTLDENSLNYFKENKINREAALELLKEEDIQEREKLLNEAVKILKNRVSAHANKVKKLEQEKTLEKIKLENVKIDIINNVDGAKEKLTEQENIIKECDKNLDIINDECPIKITNKDISNAKIKNKSKNNKETSTTQANSENNILTLSKIKKYWGEALEKAHNNLDINKKDLLLVASIIDGIEHGERDIVYILEKHYKDNYKNE